MTCFNHLVNDIRCDIRCKCQTVCLFETHTPRDGIKVLQSYVGPCAILWTVSNTRLGNIAFLRAVSRRSKLYHITNENTREELHVPNLYDGL